LQETAEKITYTRNHYTHYTNNTDLRRGQGSGLDQGRLVGKALGLLLCAGMNNDQRAVALFSCGEHKAVEEPDVSRGVLQDSFKITLEACLIHYARRQGGIAGLDPGQHVSAV